MEIGAKTEVAPKMGKRTRRYPWSPRAAWRPHSNAMCRCGFNLITLVISYPRPRMFSVVRQPGIVSVLRSTRCWWLTTSSKPRSVVVDSELHRDMPLEVVTQQLKELVWRFTRVSTSISHDCYLWGQAWWWCDAESSSQSVRSLSYNNVDPILEFHHVDNVRVVDEEEILSKIVHVVTKQLQHDVPSNPDAALWEDQVFVTTKSHIPALAATSSPSHMDKPLRCFLWFVLLAPSCVPHGLASHQCLFDPKYDRPGLAKVFFKCIVLFTQTCESGGENVLS